MKTKKHNWGENDMSWTQIAGHKNKTGAWQFYLLGGDTIAGADAFRSMGLSELLTFLKEQDREERACVVTGLRSDEPA